MARTKKGPKLEELKAEAKKKGCVGYSRMRKDELENYIKDCKSIREKKMKAKKKKAEMKKKLRDDDAPVGWKPPKAAGFKTPTSRKQELRTKIDEHNKKACLKVPSSATLADMEKAYNARPIVSKRRTGPRKSKAQKQKEAEAEKLQVEKDYEAARRRGKAIYSELMTNLERPTLREEALEEYEQDADLDGLIDDDNVETQTLSKADLKELDRKNAALEARVREMDELGLKTGNYKDIAKFSEAREDALKELKAKDSGRRYTWDDIKNHMQGKNLKPRRRLNPTLIPS